ncbi:hypothetical protein, partial [Klebsiella aerogenes]|uniref:hypothetical protein n=1 Tax=Klebsiella aerogenes TaxID=548 RepID=UPI0013D36F41
DVTEHQQRRRILALHNKLTLKPEDVSLIVGLGRGLLSADPAFRRSLAGRSGSLAGPAIAQR